MTELDGIPMSMENREALEANEIFNIKDLQAASFRKVASITNEDDAKAIEDVLIEKTGVSFSNSKRKSLKTTVA